MSNRSDEAVVSFVGRIVGSKLTVDKEEVEQAIRKGLSEICIVSQISLAVVDEKDAYNDDKKVL